MTIILDNVSSLFHISIMDQFLTYITLDYTEACSILMELLEVEEATNAEMRQCQRHR